MFRDLAVLVQEQSKQLDVVETQVGEAHTAVKAGNNELREASKLQGALTKKVVCFSVLIRACGGGGGLRVSGRWKKLLSTMPPPRQCLLWPSLPCQSLSHRRPTGDTRVVHGPRPLSGQPRGEATVNPTPRAYYSPEKVARKHRAQGCSPSRPLDLRIGIPYVPLSLI